MQQDKIFADGFVFKRREGAPDFVIGRQSIKVDEAIAFLKANVNQGELTLPFFDQQIVLVFFSYTTTTIYYIYIYFFYIHENKISIKDKGTEY